MHTQKNKAIEREFLKILKQVPEDRLPIAQNLVKELRFIAYTLDELKHEVRERGVVDLFQQGKQEFLRESPALKAYNTTVQRYSLLWKQLADLLPKDTQDMATNELVAFLKAD